MNIFITGGTGFLGSYFLHSAVQQGHSLTALRRTTDSQPRIPVFQSLCWLEKDLCDVTSEDLAGSEVIVHLAAAGVKAASRSWPEALETNILGTLRLFEAARNCPTGMPSFLTARTFYEDLVLQQPELLENSYIATKRAASESILMRSGAYEAPICFARIFQVYGPLDDARNVLSYAASQFVRGQKARFGSGRGLRDWINVHDATRILLEIVKILPNLSPSTVHNFDLGSGCLYTVREMVEHLAEIAKLDPLSVCEFDSSRDRRDADLALAASRFLPGVSAHATHDRGLHALWLYHLEGNYNI